MKRIAGVMVIGGVLILGGCASGPPQCPTVPESGSWKMGALESEVRFAIRELLSDPGSLDYHGATANKINATTRADGSSYFSLIIAQFTAKNAFGGRVSGAAEVSLYEDEQGVCSIRRVELF